MVKQLSIIATCFTSLVVASSATCSGQQNKELAARFASENIGIFRLIYSLDPSTQEETIKHYAGLLDQAFPDAKPDDVIYLCLSAALQKDDTKIQQTLDRWQKAEPNAFDPLMIRLIWLHEQKRPAPQKADQPSEHLAIAKSFPDQWRAVKAAMNQSSTQFGEHSLEMSLNFLANPGSLLEAIEFFNLTVKLAQKDANDAFSIYYSFSRKLDESGGLKKPEIAESWRQSLEGLIKIHIKKSLDSKEDTRQDFLSHYLNDFVEHSLTLGKAKPGSQFLESQQIVAADHKNGLEQIEVMNGFLSSSRLQLIAKFDPEQASQLSVQLLLDENRKFKPGEHPGPLIERLTDACLLVEKDEFPGVAKILRERGFLDLEALTRHYIAGAEKDSDLHEQNKVAIARLLNAYARRFYESGAGAKVANSFYPLEKLHGFHYQVNDEEPKPVIGDDESSQYFWNSFRFHSTLSKIYFFGRDKSLYDDLMVEKEVWLNVSDERKKNLSESYIVLVLIDREVLIEDSISSSMRELNANSKKKFGDRVFIAAVIDDDRAENGLQKGMRDPWHPPLGNKRGMTNEEIFKKWVEPGFPVIYSYQSKLLDHLTPFGGNHRNSQLGEIRRTLIFDKHRKLRRVIFDGQDRFESTLDVIDKLLAEDKR